MVGSEKTFEKWDYEKFTFKEQNVSEFKKLVNH